jgi:hypothetical protein
MMDTRRLLGWGDLEDRRRRRARRGLGALPPIAWSALAGLALAAEVARGMRLLGDGAAGDATPGGASSLWLGAVAASHIAVLFGAPFRMFWRRDSAFIGRLPIPGRAAFHVALIRSLRATALVSLPCAMAAAVFALGEMGSVEIALRHGALLAIAALGAALLGPAVALAGGAIVASDAAQQMLGNFGGEFQPPRTSWLGALPGLAAGGLALVLIAAGSWARGAEETAIGSAPAVLGIAAAIPLLAIGWALRRADAVMLAAVREVAALDRERLAHVELTVASPLERAVGAVLGRGARAVFLKDTALARRRFPIPFFLGFVGLVCLLILAATRPDDLLVWAAVISGCLGAYGAIMARRLMAPPIEHPRLLAALPIAPRAARRAKRARVLLWIGFYIALGGAAVIARSPQPAVAAIALGVIAAVSALAALAIVSAPQTTNEASNETTNGTAGT